MNNIMPDDGTESTTRKPPGWDCPDAGHGDRARHRRGVETSGIQELPWGRFTFFQTRWSIQQAVRQQ